MCNLAGRTRDVPERHLDRVETDHGGVYVAHITKADGAKVTVGLDKGFAITGKQ